MALLEVENLQTHFRTHSGINRAVNGVSFHVDEGETLAPDRATGFGNLRVAVSCVPSMFDSLGVQVPCTT